MKKQIVIAGAVLFCSFVFGTVEGVAQQIFNQFRQPVLVTGKPYRDLNDCGGITKNTIPATSFTLPPTGIVNRDDGYARINFPGGLRFSYAGVQYNNVFVSVNGFLTFDGTKLVPAKESAGLFTNSASYPDNVIAPFWGDHYYRSAGADVNNGYMPSEISWALDYDRDENCEVIDSTRPCLVVQWRNLNINDASVNSSVGNFQARLYFSNADSNWQGDIEFAYGDLVPGALGISEPTGERFPIDAIELILVPALAIDSEGNRLGKGRGYYDRVLKTSVATAVGVVFDGELVEELEVEEHDVRMQYAITPTKLLQFNQ